MHKIFYRGSSLRRVSQSAAWRIRQTGPFGLRLRGPNAQRKGSQIILADSQDFRWVVWRQNLLRRQDWKARWWKCQFRPLQVSDPHRSATFRMAATAWISQRPSTDSKISKGMIGQNKFSNILVSKSVAPVNYGDPCPLPLWGPWWRLAESDPLASFTLAVNLRWNAGGLLTKLETGNPCLLSIPFRLDQASS